MKMISVIVPVYNMKIYLKRCMKTLIMQTQDNYEIILVDDGSTDGSSEICDEYAKENPDLIRVIHKENGGLSSARNAGIEEATGRYIIFPDPDDWVEPDYLKALVELKKKYKTDLVCTGYSIDYDDNRKIIGLNESTVIMDQVKALESLFIPPCMNGFAWNKLYRLDIIKQNKLFFLDNVGTTEDLDFAYRYIKYSRSVVFAPNIASYHYYQRDGAATHSRFSEKMIDSIHTYEKIIGNEKDNIKITNAAKVEICNTSLNLLLAYYTAGENNRNLFNILVSHFRENIRYYMFTKKYNVGRKMQAALAWVSPKMLWYCKKIVRR